MRPILTALALLMLPSSVLAQKPRERDLKLPIGGTPGPLDAITDVAGVEVGHSTLISSEGKLVFGKGPVRTGVTIVHPRGKANADPVFAAWFTLNGNGEMTGTTWVQESGLLEGPVAITNTHSVGVVRDAIIQWEVSRQNALQPWWLPVVAETYDGRLNDINGFHVKPEHVIAALDGATAGLPKEGVVGGGTGMICHGSKAASALRRELATDAPLLPHQLKRIATRVSLGVGRQGGFGGNSSGDIFVAFSTANARAWFNDAPVTTIKMLPNDRITPLFQATAQATEAAITNALLAAETTTGANDFRVYALPADRLMSVMKKYSR